LAVRHGFTVWLTGLPSAGKSSLASALAAVIRDRGIAVEVIDSGKLRSSPLGATLGFSRDDRDVNVHRHAFAASLLARNGVVAIVAAVSPYRATRQAIRAELSDFFEVHVATPREVCIERDDKGLWQRAMKGEITHFTGVDDPYEAPELPEAQVDLSHLSPWEAAQRLVQALEVAGRLSPRIGGGTVPEEDRELLAQRLSDLGYSQ